MITEYVENDKVYISFKDNAGGISEDILPKIFEPYFTTKHQARGIGLGLSNTYNLIVNGMNGELEARNVEFKVGETTHKGAEFLIILPIN